MELSKYIKNIQEESKAREITLELRLDDECNVSSIGKHKVRLKLIKKEK